MLTHTGALLQILGGRPLYHKLKIKQYLSAEILEDACIPLVLHHETVLGLELHIHCTLKWVKFSMFKYSSTRVKSFHLLIKFGFLCLEIKKQFFLARYALTFLGTNMNNDED